MNVTTTDKYGEVSRFTLHVFAADSEDADAMAMDRGGLEGLFDWDHEISIDTSRCLGEVD